MVYKLFFASLMCISLVRGHTMTDFHYPEARTYTSADQGYTQYGAPSLHGKGQYVLTYDDGPHPIYTPQILDHLKASGVKATFFIITSKVTQKTFPIIERMLNEGHIVASHGSFHDNSNQISRESWKSKVKQSFKDLAQFYQRAGVDFTKFYYRFPYAAYGKRSDHHHLNTLREISQELMGDNCIHFTFWDHDSGDWIPGMSSQEVAGNFRAIHEGGKFISYKTITKEGRRIQVKNPLHLSQPVQGGVLLLHDIQASSPAATQQILNYAQEKGIEFAALDEVEEFRITKNCRL
jgi:peptidoglycan-N-acetylglucosamine deacetylase